MLARFSSQAAVLLSGAAMADGCQPGLSYRCARAFSLDGHQALGERSKAIAYSSK